MNKKELLKELIQEYDNYDFETIFKKLSLEEYWNLKRILDCIDKLSLLNSVKKYEKIGLANYGIINSGK